jgi:porin
MTCWSMGGVLFGQFQICTWRGIFFASALMLCQPVAKAQDQTADATSNQPPSGTEILKRAAQGGGLGGPQSAGAQLEEDAVKRETTSRRPGVDALFQPAEDALARLKEKTGLQIGFDYQGVWQGASDSLTDNDEASAGHVRMIGKWQLVGRGTKNPGSLSFILEQRHELWDELTPGQLAGDIGYLGVTGTAFSDSGGHLTVAYWEQALAEGRAGFVAGRIDPTDYTDILGYANQRTTFLNLSSLINPTVGAPDPGFGFGAGGLLTDQVYTLGVISDANGSLKDVHWFPGGDELYTYGELGWTPSRGQRYTTNVHVGAWHVDKREDAGVPESHGVVASANVTLRDVFMPFVRAGWSDGAAPLFNTHYSGGFLYYFPQYSDLIGFSAAYDEPSASGLRNQTTLEAFYRYQFSDNVAITANAQLLIDPALHPSEDKITVFGVRARFNM